MNFLTIRVSWPASSLDSRRLSTSIARNGKRPGLPWPSGKAAITAGPKGTTKAQPTRARLLYDRGFTVVEIMQALQVSRRTVYRYLAAEEKA